MSRILSVNIAVVVHEGAWTGSEGRTGIDKRAIDGPVELKNNGVEGDLVVDRKHHGGYDKAVYAYAREDADWWETIIGKPIANGQFGENLTTLGIDVNQSTIGQRWRIGSTLLEVSEPRIPCRVFAGFWDRPTLIKDFTEAGRPGAYLRIIQEGKLQVGDKIEVVETPTHGVTISDLFAAKSGNRSQISRIKQVSQLSESYKDWLSRIG